MFYPPLLYLLVRMLIRGARSRSRRRGHRLPPAHGRARRRPPRAGGRADRRDAPPVRASSTSPTRRVIGAYKLLHGQSLYYPSLGHGDTYGPIAYLAYAPFELIWPGGWPYLPAARAAAITFDLLTIAGLIGSVCGCAPGGATDGGSDCFWRGFGPRARSACSAWRRAPTTGWWR